MNAARIHPDTRLGPVHLTVRDLPRALAFYTGRLGLAVRDRADGTARLGAGGPDLLVLRESPEAPRAPWATGLYHFAVLVPSRRDLARALAHLLDSRTPLSGAADHGVSEAVYLPDPEGNGIEVYRDRPRAEWPLADGGVRMTTDPLDVQGLLAEAEDPPAAWNGLPTGTRIGHVHLRVARLDEAERFYVGVLGFDRMQLLNGSALFVSAGGYHHHLGLNTWAGVGAPPPPPGAAGLDHFVLHLPDTKERDRVLARARAAGLEIGSEEGVPALTDPSSHRVVLAAGEKSGEG